MTHTVLARYAHVTDMHLNPLNRIPAARTETYHEDTAEELRALRERVRELNVDAVLISGDLFNLKNSSLYFPEHILHYARYFSEFHCPIYTIPGNHDLPQSSYANLGKSAYALLHEACPKLHNLAARGHVTQTITAGTATFPVNIIGIPFMPVPDFIAHTPAFTAEMEKLGGLNIVLIHTDIAPDTEIPAHWAMISYQELLRSMPRADVICAGHIHHSYPVFTQVNATTGRPQVISKPYSFARIVKDYYATMADLAERHVPSVSVIELRQEPGKLYLHTEYQPLPCVTFEHAFVQDSLKRELDKSTEISGFLDGIRAQYGDINAAFHITSPLEFFTKLEIPEAVRAIIAEYVEA